MDYMESDRIVHLLTKEMGLVAAIAKGALRSRKRFPGALEPFCEVQLDMHRGRTASMHRIEQAVLIDPHMALREDLHLLGHAAVLLEMAKEHLGLHDPAPSVYACLKEALAVLGEARQWFAPWCLFMLEMLACLGYGVDVGATGRVRDAGGPEGQKALSARSRAFMARAPHLGRDALMRVVLDDEAKGEIRLFLLARCAGVSVKPLKSVMFLAKLLDLDVEQCYMS